ncbi:MAG: metallophosphoesterase [Pirellulales bacterium]|jgi:hypothetical protein|nr:metallophosphoesterase [Pirellulales bacterium]
MYDLIGDIHGHADALTRLLTTLGYTQRQGVYEHPQRQAVFLGDFIDRGPKIAETLAIVRPMVEAGQALSVMGNHELNALAFHTPHPTDTGNHLRPHNDKNARQHAETIRQLSRDELASALAWFRTLPLWLDLGGLRAVHACWDPSRMAMIEGPVTDDFLREACLPEGSLLEPVEAILKGKQIRLPEGTTFFDKDGHQRSFTRAKWYEPPHGHTFSSYAMASEPIASTAALPAEVLETAVPYPPNDKPVFVGHYWLSGSSPTLLRDNVACLDWSVAKGGFLCSYRWDGEQTLSAEKFVWTQSS